MDVRPLLDPHGRQWRASPLTFYPSWVRSTVAHSVGLSHLSAVVVIGAGCQPQAGCSRHRHLPVRHVFPRARLWPTALRAVAPRPSAIDGQWWPLLHAGFSGHAADPVQRPGCPAIALFSIRRDGRFSRQHCHHGRRQPGHHLGGGG